MWWTFSFSCDTNVLYFNLSKGHYSVQGRPSMSFRSVKNCLKRHCLELKPRQTQYQQEHGNEVENSSVGFCFLYPGALFYKRWGCSGVVDVSEEMALCGQLSSGAVLLKQGNEAVTGIVSASREIWQSWRELIEVMSEASRDGGPPSPWLLWTDHCGQWVFAHG
ncbi:hypothetical protein ACOMHN_011860 [Nucella lapillus]